jgi:hypothetical protein
VLAIALVITFALIVLSHPVSAVTFALMASNSSQDASNSAENPNGDNGRKCPCGCFMQRCPADSEYKWICRCGYCVPR